MPATPTLPAKLSYWITHRLSILFRGRHGVGTTAIVQKAFERAGLRWRRFLSPQFKLDEVFEDATVEAIFFDDLERLPKKLRSAFMDLVRDRSERLPLLKIVWGAMSVADDDFDELEVESVEPFNVTVEVP